MSMSRRNFIKTSAAGFAALSLPPGLALAAGPRTAALQAGVFEQALRPDGPKAEFWGYNGSLPGPVLRWRKGETVRVGVENGLAVETTVHWHGVRVPNAMDGVPFVTQEPIGPGERFTYEYTLRDSGTFWYHPHHSSFEQVARGLYGALIIEEEKPIEVDREVVWLLSDVKLGADGRQVKDHGRILDIANEGRLGNQILVNGEAAGTAPGLAVRSGERLRLRLVNAASARIFELAVAGHAMTVIAFDGQAVEPHAVDQIVLGPGMRVDVVIDCLQAPGGSYPVLDRHRRGLGALGALVYGGGKALRDKPMAAPLRLQPNDLPEPDLAKANDHYIMFQGGMRGAPVVGKVDGKATRTHAMLEKYGLAWTMNYSAEHEHALMHEPLLKLGLGEHVLLHMINETDFAHPMHLHGHFFRVVAVDGQKTRYQEWRDTVMIGPRQSIDVAFVADNPGEWMYHCHILDHAAGGMMGTIQVG